MKDTTEQAEHISDNGLTALCGVSLADPDAPERPVCAECQEVARLPFWARWVQTRRNR